MFNITVSHCFNNESSCKKFRKHCLKKFVYTLRHRCFYLRHRCINDSVAKTNLKNSKTRVGKIKDMQLNSII